MNIFYLHSDPCIAATYLCDIHIRKMHIEAAQMLSTTHWLTNSIAPYKKTHISHPSTIWVRESIQHYDWLIIHGLEVCKEFEKRYGKHHKTQDVLEWLEVNKPDISNKGFKEPPQCMPDNFKDKDTILAYRKYYIEDKIKGKNFNYNKLNNTPEWVLNWRS